MSNLFGSSTTTTKPALTLNLGATASQPQQSGGLFGSTQPSQGGGLFGASTSQPQQQQAGGLFGSTSQPAQGGGLFGASTAQPQQQQSGGLFGSTSQPTQGGGLFGASTQPQQQQSTLGSSLFGASTQQPAQQGGGLFGSTQQNTTQGGGLFGASTQPQQAGGLFGSTTQQPQQGGGLFGASTAQQQQPTQGSLFGSLGASASRPQAYGSSLWQPGASYAPREKSIPEQIFTILEKWSPESPNCVFQHYFYNSVDPKLIPYYGPAPGEDEKKWEEALAKKPSEGSIPTLAKGFAAVGNRMEFATKAVEQLQRRMHEINNSLTANMQNHELKITVRAAEARRRHTTLSQRCLALATKVQVLRNRGYQMDSAEEALKLKLAQLEKSAYDPVLNGRQEEIWARLSELRERAMLLQEESEKLGKAAKGDQEGAIDEDTMKAIKKLLNDYDSQLVHLKKELDSIDTDFGSWEKDKEPTRGR